MKLSTRLSKVDLAVSVVLFVLFAFFSWELYYAWIALPCFEMAYEGCYPWGGEGPAGDYWFAGTKERHLFRGVSFCLLFAGGLVSLLFLPKGHKKTLLVTIVVVTTLFIFWVLDKNLAT